MTATVTTIDGDMIDRLAHDAYGRTAGAAEAVMAANPHLAGLGPVLPAGLIVVLPDLAPPVKAGTVRLWD